LILYRPVGMIETSHAAIFFLHYPFWKRRSFSDEGVTDDEDAWMNTFPGIPLTISCG
jgi:hypothetical protein